MDIGKLKHRVTIQYISSTTTDTMGTITNTWSDRAIVWAGLRPLTARELVQAQTVQSETNYQITIRYLSTVTVKDRIKFIRNNSTRYFSITGIINTNETNEQLVLLCTETK